jgi:hypothetical protein
VTEFDIKNHFEKDALIFAEIVIMIMFGLDITIRFYLIGKPVFKDTCFILDVIIFVLCVVCFLYMCLRKFSYLGEDFDLFVLITRCALMIIRFFHVFNQARTNVKNQKELGPMKLDEYQNPSEEQDYPRNRNPVDNFQKKISASQDEFGSYEDGNVENSSGKPGIESRDVNGAPEFGPRGDGTENSYDSPQEGGDKRIEQISMKIHPEVDRGNISDNEDRQPDLEDVPEPCF